MRKVVFGLLCLLVFELACKQPNGRNNKVGATHEKLVRKNYKPFLEKFLTDSATQLSSIKFPLKSVVQGEDGDIVKDIDLKEWKYTNFRNVKDYIISSQLVKENKFQTIIEMEDTGVHVIYTFEFRKGKWWLTLIEDAST